MSLEEKVDAFSTNPTVPRLGVVGTGHVEGLHGLALGGPGHWEGRNETVIPTTTFPQSRGLGQTWDPALLQKAAAQEAYETRYAFGKYHRGGLVVRAPNADLSRDPRWGRSEESYGEDPFLVGTLATAYTRGLQGDGKYWMTASLLKHFLANSNENLRTSSSSNFDERLFQEYYSVPFRMAIEDGHANAFMTAYNSWNGTPMIENPVLRNVVMKVWGEDGIICTDGGALTALVKDHHAYKTLPEAVAATVHAGINQYLDNYKPSMEEALKLGLIDEADLDRNLRGVFRVMIKLGMLDPTEMVPYARIGFDDGVGKELAADPWWQAQPKELARKVTDESIVLLKNDAGSNGRGVVIVLDNGEVEPELCACDEDAATASRTSGPRTRKEMIRRLERYIDECSPSIQGAGVRQPAAMLSATRKLRRGLTAWFRGGNSGRNRIVASERTAMTTKTSAYASANACCLMAPARCSSADGELRPGTSPSTAVFLA
jgi:beta-glucosidase